MNTMSMSWALTTALNANSALIQKAQELADTYRCPYISRKNYNFTEMQDIYGYQYILILDRNNRLFLGEPYLTWHPSMAVPRIRGLHDGKQDPFLTALNILPGDSILDCTLGFGSDALVAAWATGDSGQVLGLEASPVLAALTQWGMQHQSQQYECKKVPMQQIISRLNIINCFSLDYLANQPDNSWDTVYFDPMFKSAVRTSAAMNSMRPVACYNDFDKNLLNEALRVCRKRVVVKERSFSKLFTALDCPQIQCSKYGSIAYGIWLK